MEERLIFDDDEFDELEVKMNLQLQLDELELLSAIYPNELKLDNEAQVCDMKQYILVDGNVPIELSCIMPFSYPTSPPDLHVRCQTLQRHQQRYLNNDLVKMVVSRHSNEVIVHDVISWLQDHLADYVTAPEPTSNELSLTQRKTTALSRMWLYCHHIYKKGHLERIKDSLNDLELTGFTLPGMPGIIAVEGCKEAVDMYWSRLKITGWRKVYCKHRIDHSVDESSPLNEQLQHFRIFSGFEVLHFNAHGSVHYHQDLGAFREYLKKKDHEHIYHILFGIGDKERDKPDN